MQIGGLAGHVCHVVVRVAIRKKYCLSLQIAMGGFVSYFFSGFIMGKIPFPLSPSFRIMLQVRKTTCSSIYCYVSSTLHAMHIIQRHSFNLY